MTRDSLGYKRPGSGHRVSFTGWRLDELLALSVVYEYLPR